MLIREKENNYIFEWSKTSGVTIGEKLTGCLTRAIVVACVNLALIIARGVDWDGADDALEKICHQI